ncbi:hypothetical protein NIES4072_36790 [Nostoc commune NIES-4072]|uniref:Uncharacterized protein n=1 Tax=Nostoc commune NIES-4072 TaxID=2005467 RepID=A0A2R5FMM0_NOSCO|nr:hypothetical protein NIES4070_53970 [Nostoc commune HK-02]GBG20010.1 hypothetical protein NIES4072_36790 [Nostoc commune NIES-4072]
MVLGEGDNAELFPLPSSSFRDLCKKSIVQNNYLVHQPKYVVSGFYQSPLIECVGVARRRHR